MGLLRFIIDWKSENIKNMVLEQKVKRVTDIFAMILEAKDIKGLEKIEKIDDIKNYKIDLKKYPELKFSINKGDINELTSKNIINSQDFQDNLKTPLEKLLYAMAWKNGDLLKLKHIIKGFSDASNSINETESAFVFYHFGRHLANPDVEPIIDQHILRAFMVYKINENDIISDKFNKILKFTTIGKKEKELIKEYKEWLVSDELSEVAKIEDYGYYIDRILFALGKSIKLKK